MNKIAELPNRIAQTSPVHASITIAHCFVHTHTTYGKYLCHIGRNSCANRHSLQTLCTLPLPRVVLYVSCRVQTSKRGRESLLLCRKRRHTNGAATESLRLTCLTKTRFRLANVPPIPRLANNLVTARAIGLLVLRNTCQDSSVKPNRPLPAYFRFRNVSKYWRAVVADVFIVVLFHRSHAHRKQHRTNNSITDSTDSGCISLAAQEWRRQQLPIEDTLRAVSN